MLSNTYQCWRGCADLAKSKGFKLGVITKYQDKEDRFFLKSG